MDHLFCYLCFTFVFIIMSSLFLLALFCVMFPCACVTFPYGVSGQVWYWIVSIPVLCLLLYKVYECSKLWSHIF